MTKGLKRSLSRGAPQLRDIIKQTVSMNSLPVSVTSTGAAAGFGTAVVEGLPQGNILLLGVVSYLTLSGPTSADLSNTWNGDFSFGTSPTADVTLNGAEVNLIPSTAFGAATTEVSPTIRATNAVQSILDNTDGSMEINLNVLIDATSITDDRTVVMRASGVIQLAYIVMLDD